MSMRRRLLSLVALLSLFGLGTGCTRQAPPSDGPWNRDLYMLESSDGLSFGESRLFVERGGVPSVTRDAKGRLIAVFQWFPFDRREAFDRVAVRISGDEGKTWSDPQPIEVKGLPAGYQRPFDPAITLLDDGRIRVYFTSSAGDPGPGRQTQIYSGVSSDGVGYTFEPGARFAVEGERAFDCSIARMGKAWHYFSPVAGPEARALHAVSDDGLNFTRLPDITLPEQGASWIGNPVATEEGLRFYGSGPQGVWSAFSQDGSNWQMEVGTRAQGGDPAVVQRRDGSFLMIVTGQTRAGSAPRPIERSDAAAPQPLR